MDIIKPRPDLSKEYGTVSEGGGAKNTYRVRARCTPRKADIRIKGAADTSVGVLSGTFICMGDFEKTECIWENISYSRVMDVDDELMERLGKFSLRDISSLASLNVRGLTTGATRVLRDGDSDIAPLRALIEDMVDREKIRNSDGELYVVTYSTSNRHPLVTNVKEALEGIVADLLMASAYLVGFRQKWLGGKYYMDGGGINSVPVDVSSDRGYKDVIIMCIYGHGVDTEKKLEIPGGVNPYHVAPRRGLGGLLEFDRRRAKRNMLSGYFDGRRMLYGLAGCVYYIDASESEPYYFDRVMSETQSPLPYTRSELETAGEARTGREVQKETTAEYCICTEQVFPRLAKELKLKGGWDYKELYLSILEDSVRRYRIGRFKIYAAEEFLRLIHKKAGATALGAMVPALDSGTQVQRIMHKDV